MASDGISLQVRVDTLKAEKECSDLALAAALLEVEMLKKRLDHGRWCPQCKLWLKGLQRAGEKCGTCMGNIEWRPLADLHDQVGTLVKALQFYADRHYRKASEALDKLRMRYPV